jgi:uncharacterized protein (DUF1810 family)
MTLFEAADPNPIFARARQRWCNGTRDERTLRLLPAR